MRKASPREELQLPAGQRKDYLGGNCDNNIDNIYRNGQGWTLRKSYIVMISTINSHGGGNLRDAFFATSCRILKRLVCRARSDFPRDVSGEYHYCTLNPLKKPVQ